MLPKSFHIENRKALYETLEEGSVLVLFAGAAPRQSADAFYPFHANRNFVYITGCESEHFIFMAVKARGEVKETMFILPSNDRAEKWTGHRLRPDEVAEMFDIFHTEYVENFDKVFHRVASMGAVNTVWINFDKFTAAEQPDQAQRFARRVARDYPHLTIKNVFPTIRKMRTIKKPCEIEAMKKAMKATRAGILAMMKACRPGMMEYQLKAEFDYALTQMGVLTPCFNSIIASGKNNFCIHYYAYTGEVHDGDMILNDVGACWDNEYNDVSRGWPANGRFSERQRQLYECAYKTSEYLFSIIKPGMPMADVDRIAREYNYELLHELGLVDSYEEVGKLIWHGGAHHVGYDVHDIVDSSGLIEPGMVFCVDIGIYCEEWGIGFRLEDNCLVTEDGCVNLSADIPRSIEEIEAAMAK